MRIFRELGERVESRWRATHYDSAAFITIACEALTEAGLPDRVAPLEIVQWVFGTTDLPQQPDLEARFGNPPITLYAAPRFYIDAYFWLDGSTSIHQHAFSGAFQVLDGSSLHSRFRFRQEQAVSSHFRIGQVELDSVELLARGAVRPIHPGGDLIHSLFHLDRPSTSVVIRTSSVPSTLPQWDYYPPGVALNPFLKDPLLTRQLQTASLLLCMRHPETDRLLADLMTKADLHTAFALLDLVYAHQQRDALEQRFVGATDRFAGLLAFTQNQPLAARFPQVFEEKERKHNIILRRDIVTRPEHRFLLALLLNVPDRQRVLDLVRERYPDENPVDTIVGWVIDLSQTRALHSREPNVLGIDSIDDGFLFALECLLKGLSPAEIRAAYVEENHTQPDPTDLGHQLDRVRTSSLFKGLFRPS